MIQADVEVLRKELDKMTIKRSDLEMQIENLKADLLHLKRNHTEVGTPIQTNTNIFSKCVVVMN